MEYQLRLERALDHQHIERLIKAWLRGAAPVPAGPGPGIRTLGPSWPGGSGVVDLFPGGTRAVTAPAHNVHSSHQMQTAGEVLLAAGVHLRQLSPLGGKAKHIFVVNGRELYFIQQAGLHGEWLRLSQHWHAPISMMITPAPVNSWQSGLRPSSGAGSVFDPATWRGGSDAGVVGMSAWQKLRAAAWEGVKQSGSAAYDLVVAPLLTWEGALTLVGLTGLLLIPYVGQVVLVGLAGVAIYDLLKNVTHLFKEYYDRAVGATSWSELRSAGKLFAQAVVGGLLDVLGIFVGATALARLRALRVAGRLTVGTWLALVEEQAQALRVRLRGGIKKLGDLLREQQEKPPGAGKSKPLSRLLPTLEKYAAQGLDRAKLQAAYDAAPDKAKFLAKLEEAPTIYAKQEMIRDFDNIPGVKKGADPNPDNRLIEKSVEYSDANGELDPSLDLPSRNAPTFSEAHPKPLKPGTKLYRVVGADARDNGGYWVTEENLPKEYSDVIGGTAVKPSWNNGMTEIIEYTVPEEGMVVWEGPASSQPIGEPPSPNHHLPGGDKQIYIPEKYRDWRNPKVLEKFNDGITKRTPIEWKR